MPKLLIYAVVLAAIALPSILIATQERQPTEARVAAFKHEDGRIEFAIQVREGSGWGERILPRGRFLRPTASTGRWIPSTPVTLAQSTVEEETLIADDEAEPRSGNVGPLYEWRYGFDNTELSRYRVEWDSNTPQGRKYILITVPDRNEHECDEYSPCRYELMFWCDADLSSTGLIVFLRKFWFLNNRVATWSRDLDRNLHEGLQQVGWEHREPVWQNRIATSADDSSFSNGWQIYVPGGQGRFPGERYGSDFALEGSAAHAFMNRVTQRQSVSITVSHKYSDDDTVTFDVTGAFENPTTRLLEQCRQ